MSLSASRKRFLVSCAIAIGLPTIAIVGLAMTCARVSREMDQLNTMSIQASQAAFEIHQQCPQPGDQPRVDKARKDLAARFADLQSPARVVAGLSEACRRQGTTVLEIAPIVPRRDGSDPAGAPRRYRLLVQGTYREIAALLDGCSRQRLPARVIEFSISPVEGKTQQGLLSAMIVMESFAPS